MNSYICGDNIEDTEIFNKEVKNIEERRKSTNA